MENIDISLRKKSIGKNIKNIRLSMGLTLDEFGGRFVPTASSSIVSKWERGVSTPSPARLKKLAELANTTVDVILTSTTDKMFLEQLNDIQEYYTVNQDKFEQDLSNFYLFKRLALKYLSAGMCENREVVSSIEDLFHTLDTLLTESYYTDFSKNQKNSYEEMKKILNSVLDDIYEKHMGDIAEKG